MPFFLAPGGATEKHGNIINAIFNFVYDKKSNRAWIDKSARLPYNNSEE